ncbi:toll/interleukin-1 receptor domain-containing protein [Paraburkholderia tropica]|uniref:toll/interleukin-1 receptor domain-containing protein n=1 Tax=Paraburkholderia tropica TaxID=92647 RepID=UPI00161A5C3F|nr:toll/interleukin-1 receptor domain-containing protein [Paraburkholderia tropica]MBB2983408.1 hypothetical protein [Paraburkholderia tropica]
MYNLLMTGGSGNWNNPTWVMGADRLFEYTHDAFKEKFGSMSDEVVSELISFPTLFAYERGVPEPARVGRITRVQRGYKDFTITFSIDPSIPPIMPDRLMELYNVLDISERFEQTRTHWAVKDIDLGSVLSNAGIVASPAALLPQPPPPKVFISYSWDSPEHRQWVAGFATHLRQNGIEVILDQWHMRAGENMAAFMERSVRESDRVLMICTEKYVEKTMSGTGSGVAFEHMIVTGELMRDVGTTKFVPVVRQSLPQPIVPREMFGRRYINLSDGPHQTGEMGFLLREIHNAHAHMIPPLGTNPFRNW